MNNSVNNAISLLCVCEMARRNNCIYTTVHHTQKYTLELYHASETNPGVQQVTLVSSSSLLT